MLARLRWKRKTWIIESCRNFSKQIINLDHVHETLKTSPKHSGQKTRIVIRSWMEGVKLLLCDEKGKLSHERWSWKIFLAVEITWHCTFCQMKSETFLKYETCLEGECSSSLISVIWVHLKVRFTTQCYHRKHKTFCQIRKNLVCMQSTWFFDNPMADKCQQLPLIITIKLCTHHDDCFVQKMNREIIDLESPLGIAAACKSE